MGTLGIGIRVLLMWSSRSASAQRRARVLNVISLVGLGVSGIVLVSVLPKITKVAGFGKFMSDLLAHGWPLLLLTLIAGPVRTLTWRAFVGAGLAGLLVDSSLARVIGQPVMDHLTHHPTIAVAVWGPFCEELTKSLLVVLMVLLAARHTAARPSVADIVLLGAWTGAGFALYENAQYGRGGASWDAVPLLSLLNPTLGHSSVAGSSIVGAGHMVYTGVVALGLAVGLFYRRRWRFAWLAVPAGYAIAFGEHSALNAVVNSSGSLRAPFNVFNYLTLMGWLSSLLLFGATAALSVSEWRRGTRRAPGSAGGQVPPWLWLRPTEIARRGERLAAVQTTRPTKATPPAPTASVPMGAWS
jgi:RsiW-degrading membrane proteinase PrsW (M82 family)